MHLAVRTQFLALLVLALAVYAVERLIVTDAEAIEILAEEAARAALAQDGAALERCLDEEFLYEGLDRAGTIALVQRLVGRHKPSSVRIVLYEIAVEGEEAKAQGVVSGTAYGRLTEVRVDVQLRQVDDRWVLYRVRGGGFGR